MQILVVTNMYPHAADPSWGAFIMQQVNYLQKSEHIVDVFHIRGDQSKLNYLKAFWEVYFRTYRKSYDIVHVHCGLSGLPGLFCWRTPKVITFHGSDVLVGKIQPMISKFVSKFYDAVIVVSKQMASIINGNIIPCGIDLEIFKPYGRKEARLEINWPLDKYIVLFPFHPGRKIKRYDIAEAAVRKLHEKGYDIILKSVSGVKNEHMPYYYSAANVMLLCSDSEGSPTSIKEALACNTPVVTTNVGDVKNILDGINGLQVFDKDVESLSKGIENILLNEGKKDYEYRTAMKRYDQKVIMGLILEIYQGIRKKQA